MIPFRLRRRCVEGCGGAQRSVEGPGGAVGRRAGQWRRGVAAAGAEKFSVTFERRDHVFLNIGEGTGFKEADPVTSPCDIQIVTPKGHIF